MTGTRRAYQFVAALACAAAFLSAAGAVPMSDFAGAAFSPDQEPSEAQPDDDRADARREKPAEETRLPGATFRAGLRKRGLTEFLDLHLQDFPPAGRTAALLMRRDLKLAQYADATLGLEARRVALAEANRLLEELIEQSPDDLNRFTWRFDLAHSLVYDEAEPYFTAVLYRGGTPQTRRRLRELTIRAIAVLTALRDDITAEYQRLDELPVREFERLERGGHVETVDRLAPRTDYLLMWALLYDALARDDADPLRAGHLNRILELSAEDPALLDTAHAVSKVQIQALLLAGMARRLINDHPSARQLFDRALSVADRLDDPLERERIDWAVTLARIERIRNERDAGRFERALQGVVEFRKPIDDADPQAFGLRLVAALLERSVHQARAAAARSESDTSAAQSAGEQAWTCILSLVARHPDRRDEVYAAFYEQLSPDADPAALDPVQQTALIAGLLVDAASSGRSTADLGRAIEVGEHFLATAPPAAAPLVPEVLFNLGVALYRSDRLVEAAERFLQVARDHPGFIQGLQAATYAVELASSIYEDKTHHDHPVVVALYEAALTALVAGFPESEQARYWRFYRAQLIEEQGALQAAAAEYALVDEQHEQYLQSVLFRLRCLAQSLSDEAQTEGTKVIGLSAQAHAFLAEHRDVVAMFKDRLTREGDPQHTALLHDLLARATLLFAEVQVLPRIGQPARALDALADFETDHPDRAALAGRVWRVRLIAYERLGQLDEAQRALPAYIAADPQNVGPALQSLFLDLTAEVQRLHRAEEQSRRTETQRKADLALLLAEQVYAWAQRQPGPTALGAPQALLAQLARANLNAGRYAEARDLFERCGIGREPPAIDAVAVDADLAFGYAESLYQLGDYAAALAWFNYLALRLNENDPRRWLALLRDLQCRTELKHPPAGIIKVIEQQRFLYPDLGGPQSAPDFEKLLRENQRRTGDTG